MTDSELIKTAITAASEKLTRPNTVSQAHGELLLKALRTSRPGLNADQELDALTAVIASRGAQIGAELSISLEAWAIAPATPERLVSEALESREDLKPIPSIEAVERHLIKEGLRIYGEGKRPEIMINAARDARAMTPEQRLASGAEVGSQALQNRAEGKPDNTARPMHEWDYSDERWSFEVAKATGLHPGALLPSQYRATIDGLKAESRRKHVKLSAIDERTLKEIDAKDAGSLSPEERITQHRLRAHN